MRRIIMLLTAALIMAVMMVPATPAFAVPGENFPPSQAQGPKFNAVGGLTIAVANTSKPKPTPGPHLDDIVVPKILDKASPKID